ncbi:hypothetical protein [Sulfobacillus thermosulfidooxidans]|uniref:Uncharacterized protein n=1 Tax=Sulfobacillus thermosulfidooxidans (strain DSM 9293 / VKM B-1269 / AT-1) TaxID=929705 RepID=A0A1W1W7F2_SULTA|nr:hypothetical protein [Sulfobacillus thermosulfidooxidans]SMC02122.1 hypothetical protein SAMN00768000_0339 [Sulfobacillus thermosulfidooxidans DSM 9293]
MKHWQLVTVISLILLWMATFKPADGYIPTPSPITDVYHMVL